MKKIIIIHNSPNFSVDLTKLYEVNKQEISIIANPLSLKKILARHQDKLCYQIIETTDFSFIYLKKIISTIFKNHHPTNDELFIMTNTEHCVHVCGQLRDYFNLKGLNSQFTRIFTNKIKMKEKVASLGLKVPKYFQHMPNAFMQNPNLYIDNVCKNLKLPIFAKPINDANSHATFKLNSQDDLKNWLHEFQPNQNFELDEYINGKLFHIDSLIKNGEILVSLVSEYATPLYNFMEGKPFGSICLPQHSETTTSLTAYHQKIMAAFAPLYSGVTHLEVFKMDENLIFLEIAARAGGYCVPKFFKTHLDVNLFEDHFILQMNPNFRLNLKKGPHVAALYYPFPEGKVKPIQLPILSSQYSFETHVSIGEISNKSKTLREIAANIFLWNEDFSLLYQDFETLKNTNLISIYSRDSN